ncbi:putative membrane protein YccC [Ancylobacter aquaticus]|uniref:Putative membrane protein YccC n=1 Tax=Ancylobacter aquaticus TaxID=100 RepID=A0A4R1HYV1_ANCAQ|nr:FUSC family protein [Ancylobacter aquaticus]TCK28014.1 putative membrane protein YccC [Ancylobacter aquaticus]
MSELHDLPNRQSGSPLAVFEAALAQLQLLRPRIVFGLRLATSVCLALYITYYLELQNSFWAATTAAIVCQPNLGASLQKGRYRAIGTVIGGLVMVALLAMFPQHRNSLLLCLALWCGLCGFAAVLLRNLASYAAALSGITAVIIFADTLADPSGAFFLAVIRVSEICIGIASAGFVMVLTDFGAARRQLAHTLRQTAEQLASGFVATLSQGGDTPDLVSARRSVTRGLGSLHLQIDAAIGESSYLRSRTGNFRVMIEALVGALVGWRNAGTHLALHGDGRPLIRERLVPLLESIDLAQLNRAPRQLAHTAGEVAAQLRALPVTDDGNRIAIEAARDVVAGLSGLIDAIVLLCERNSPRVAAPTQPLVTADLLPALLNGARVFVAVLAMSAFWVVSAWPNGAFAIVFAAAGTLIFGSFGDQARVLAKDYAIGAASMVVLGAVLYFGVLPALSTFPALVAVLGLLFITLGILQAGTWHSVTFLGMSVASLPLLGVGNPASYDAVAYFNLALSIVTGTVVGMLFFVVMPTIPPQLRARRLLALSLRDFRRLARGAGRTDHAHWTALLTRRAEALPPQATPEDAGSLMALLSLGQAVIHLRTLMCREPVAGDLQRALDALAAGQLAMARELLESLSHGGSLTADTMDDASMSRPGQARAAAAVILDIIDLHGELLTTPPDARALFLSAFG